MTTQTTQMNTQIFRNLISDVFKVKTNDIRFVGELQPEWYEEEKNNRGNLYRCNSDLRVWGYEPKGGFTEIRGDMEGYSQNANGTWNEEYRVTFAQIAEQCPNAIYILVNHKKIGWQEGREGIEDWDEDNWKVFTVNNK